MEILAPAGNADCIDAALASGADAVYFGLTGMNARRGAENISYEDLESVVAKIHKANARAHLTLNITLKDSELTAAGRALAAAEKANVDVVIVSDLGVLKMGSAFEGLEMHLSTQGGVCNVLGVVQARNAGATRVVLAREMSLDEICECAKVEGIEVEAFVHGALCFSISGRCLASSWVGGHSGNRGMCASPCRLPFTCDGREVGRPFSMPDMTMIEYVDALKDAGVAALKIEGRLKSAGWVARAVLLYRNIISNNKVDVDFETEILSLYSGRNVSDEYARGVFPETGEQGRVSGVVAGNVIGEHKDGCLVDFHSLHENTLVKNGEVALNPTARILEDTGDGYILPLFDCGIPNVGAVIRESIAPWPKRGKFATIVLDSEGKDIKITIECEVGTEKWVQKMTPQKKLNRARFIGELDSLLENDFDEVKRLCEDAPVARRSMNGLYEEIYLRLNRLRGVSKHIKASLPASVKEMISEGVADSSKRSSLGEEPNWIRLSVSAYSSCRKFLDDVNGITLCGGIPDSEAELPENGVLALPVMWYDKDIDVVSEYIEWAKNRGWSVEANDFGGLRLALDSGVKVEAGQGLCVTNGLATSALADAGVSFATASMELDKPALESLCHTTRLPLALSVWAYPPLFVSRLLGKEVGRGLYRDERDIAVVAYKEGAACVFRSVRPFSLCSIRSKKIRAARFVVDVVGTDNPADAVSRAMSLKFDEKVSVFNFNRKLM